MDYDDSRIPPRPCDFSTSEYKFWITDRIGLYIYSESPFEFILTELGIAEYEGGSSYALLGSEAQEEFLEVYDVWMKEQLLKETLDESRTC